MKITFLILNILYLNQIFSQELSFVKINTYFEENLGQIKYIDDKPAPEVKYIFKQGNLKIFLLRSGLAYQLENYLAPTLSNGNGEAGTQLSESASADSESFFMDTTPKRLQTYRMDMELIGANPNPEIFAERKSENYTNYYHPDLIQTHNYDKITYKDIYPGIDWVVYIVDIDSNSARENSLEFKNKYSKLKIQHSKFFKYDLI